LICFSYFPAEHGYGHHMVGLLWDCQHGHLLFGLLALLRQQLFALGGGLHMGALQHPG